MASPAVVLWEPSAERVAASQLEHFRQHASAACGRPLPDYKSLHRWSTTHREQFWREIWQVCGVVGEGSLEPTLLGDAMPGAQWFPSVRLNFAENCLGAHGKDDDSPAIISTVEGNHRRVLTWRELHAQVALLAGQLHRCGVGPGVRCAAYVPNGPEAVVAVLAVASLGGVWSSCSPDFGASAVLDRLGQVAPAVLFACSSYTYKGTSFDRLAELAKILDGLPSVRHAIVTNPDCHELPPTPRESSSTAQLHLLSTLLQPPTGVPPLPLSFKRLPFDAPLYIMFSSGTTGVPKAMVHGVGGTLLQHLKEHRLHTDIAPGDVVFYFTTCGWMMWNWLVTALASAATIILYDGNPTGSDGAQPATLFQLAEAERITHFGTSAKFIDSTNKSGFQPMGLSDFPALRTILSTGSVLSPESFDWVYQQWKADVSLASITGGTDILSCFALGCPTAPVVRGELQCAGLGMAVQVFDDAGEAITDGTQGELVCVFSFRTCRSSASFLSCSAHQAVNSDAASLPLPHFCDVQLYLLTTQCCSIHAYGVSQRPGRFQVSRGIF
eukprot:COSAG05_NODE_392_length_10391_cov_8.232899_4_plen_554_part_00